MEWSFWLNGHGMLLQKAQFDKNLESYCLQGVCLSFRGFSVDFLLKYFVRPE